MDPNFIIRKEISKKYEFEEITAGQSNNVFAVFTDSEDYVLRFVHNVNVISKEKEIFSQLNNVPVPEIVSYSFENNPYMIMRKIPGIELKKVLDVSNEKTKEKLIRQCGLYLSRIHSVKRNYYGDKYKKMDKHWSDYCLMNINKNMKEIPMNVINKKEILKLVNENSHYLDDFSPVLLHADYNLTNMIAVDDKITGIFDFEWSFSGHHEFDLARSYEHIFNKHPKYESWFLDEYAKNKEIHEDFKIRKYFYLLMIAISVLKWSINIAKSESSKEKYIEVINRTVKELKKL